MENVSSFSSYPDSVNSSPRSRDIDETQSFDELNPSNYKVKFMCSYGGKIQPRPHDNQLAYIGGDTKILAVDRNIKFSQMMSKLSSLSGDHDICFKYQLPGEDLDALISVTNDEDLDHMMLEYDRLYRASAKPARLRLFLFRLNPPGYGSDEVKSERQWFVDALNSLEIQNIDASSPPAPVPAGTIPDVLFGLDKAKFVESAPPPPTVPEVMGKDVMAGSDCGSDVVGESNALNQQIQDLQRLHIAASHHEQVMLNRRIEEANSRGYTMEYYNQKLQERVSPPPVPPQPVQMPIPASFLPERHAASTAYNPVAGTEQPVYLIPTTAPVYQQQGLRPMTGQVGQGYYGVQRVVQEVYRDQPVYSAVPPPPTVSVQPQQQQKVGVYSEGIGIVQPVQVGYDSAGRQVYYTTPYQAAPPPVAAGDGRQGGVQDNKVVAGNVKAHQTSSV